MYKICGIWGKSYNKTVLLRTSNIYMVNLKELLSVKLFVDANVAFRSSHRMVLLGTSNIYIVNLKELLSCSLIVGSYGGSCFIFGL